MESSSSLCMDYAETSAPYDVFERFLILFQSSEGVERSRKRFQTMTELEKRIVDLFHLQFLLIFRLSFRLLVLINRFES